MVATNFVDWFTEVFHGRHRFIGKVYSTQPQTHSHKHFKIQPQDEEREDVCGKLRQWEATIWILNDSDSDKDKIGCQLNYNW